MKLKVLDLSRVLAGPLCSMMLGRPRRRRDKSRTAGNRAMRLGGGGRRSTPMDKAPTFFRSIGTRRAWRPISLSRDRPGDRVLMQTADVVLENFVAGSLGRLGLIRDASWKKIHRSSGAPFPVSAPAPRGPATISSCRPSVGGWRSRARGGTADENWRRTRRRDRGKGRHDRHPRRGRRARQWFTLRMEERRIDISLADSARARRS